MSAGAVPSRGQRVMTALVERHEPIAATIKAARAFREERPRGGLAVVLGRAHLLAVIEDHRAGRLGEVELREWAKALRLLDARWSYMGRPAVFALDPDDRDVVAHVVYTLAAERHCPYPRKLLGTLVSLLRALPHGIAHIDGNRRPNSARHRPNRPRRLLGLTTGLGLIALATAAAPHLGPAITAAFRAQTADPTTVTDAFGWLP
ncbi:hypothetical protein [Glycomyces harbinensis]|uniref:Uncharacterized protein n=1 Tax=Glycomyces harbinensis TaxID=58114 RepID=A0A1G6Y9M4_9ACTN|nr:hypothetical protein [Glycomyces harbinensis]SDD87129.1 hypothetical protein SAMN05216270_108216 [Glycomyces harbinensis]